MKNIVAISAVGEMYITQEGKTEHWVHIVNPKVKKSIARIYGFKSWQLK